MRAAVFFVSGVWRAVCVALVLQLLIACEAPPTDAIRFGVATLPDNLDPRFASDALSERINRLLYRRLVEFNERARAVPSLATWEAKTPLWYRFHLGSDGREFHDGTRLDACDVKATYDAVLDPQAVSPHRGVLALIARIDCPDPDTVDFHLARPDILFPSYLAVGIVPRRALEAGRSFERQPMGSGPFRLHAWTQPERLELERIADGQRIEFLNVPDPTVRVLKLMRGEVDMLQNDLAPELITFLEKRSDLVVQRVAGGNFSYLGFNLEDSRLARLPVRQAIAYAIDREGIIEHILDGGARVAGALLPPEHWAGHAQLRGVTYEPQLARAILEAEGFGPANPLTLTYKTSTDPLRVRIATAMRQQLRDVGVQLRVQSFDWGTFFGDIKAGRFELYSLAWVGIKTPDIFRYVFHSAAIPPEGANRGRYRNPLADRLIETAQAATIDDEQADIYRRLQELVAAELPYVPLWYEDHVVVMRNTIADYRPAADGNYDRLTQIRRRADGAR